MKKKLTIIISIVLCLALCGCTRVNPDGSVYEPSPSPQNEEGESSNEEVSSDDDSTDGKEKSSLYQSFLDGNELVYADLRYIPGDYDYENGKNNPAFIEGVGYSLIDVISRNIELVKKDYESGKLKYVKYAYIDCGADGVEELVLSIGVDNELMGEIVREHIIKDIDGKLEICYVAQTAYRSYDYVINKYGLITHGGSSGAFSHTDGYSAINKDGEYVYIYSGDTEFELGSDFGDLGGIYTVSSKYVDEIDESMYMTEYHFDDYYDVPSEEFNYEEYLSKAKYTAYPEDDPLINKIFEEAGIKLYSQSEMDEIIEKTALSRGISSEILNNREEPEYTELNSEEINEVVKYGTNSIKVSDVEGLINAIGSDRTIVLAPGTYNVTEYLSEHFDELTPYSYGENADNGVCVGGDNAEPELFICQVQNMTIMAEDENDRPEVVCEPRYACIINLNGVYNVDLESLVMGHTIEQGVCSGNVVGIDGSSNVDIINCDLYGCGAYGLGIYDSNGISCDDSVIHDCTYGAVTAHSNGSIYFYNCEFRDIREYTMFELGGTSYTSFVNCSFKNLNGQMISMSEDDSAYFNGCLFDVDAYNGFMNYSAGGRITINN